MQIPLRVQSDYSLLKSLITLPKLIAYLKEKQINVCGICDENLFGVMEFYDLCLAANIKPLIGLQVPFLTKTLSFYAKNYHGYQNLLKIHTALEKKEEVSALEKEIFTDLLIIMETKDLESYDTIKSFFADDQLFIAYHNHAEKNNACLKSSLIVYAPLIKAFKQENTASLDLLEAISLGTTIDTVTKGNYLYQNFTTFGEMDEDDEKTTEFFAAKCNVIIPKDKRYIPHYKEDIVDSFAYLTALTKKGLAKRLHNNIKEEYQTRLTYELSVIKQMGFVDYFLIVYDYVKYAKDNNILVGMGRGSAAGSLVSYTLGITDVDPIQYHLLFERFLNPQRVTMPDIDIDFEDTRRAEVINYVRTKYGLKNVGNIITFGTLKCKLAIRCVCKALKVDNNLAESFISLMDAKLSIKENISQEKVQKMLANYDCLAKVITESLIIEGLKKHISTHAAGVVISSVPLDEVIPIYYNNNEVLTGVTMNYLEELGLLKMDFLGIKNLTIIAKVLQLITENTGQTLNLNKIDLKDPLVLKMFQKGETIGIFQFESEGIKNFLRKLKPANFLDIVSAIALYRPGPMENIDHFIKRKEGKEPIDYLHPILEPILKETYGIIVYQEQIMQILVTIGGYSFAQADIIRRAMSKKKKELIEEQKEEFINRAIKNGYEKKLALNIYDLILKFANYGFNKSHSVSYALIGFQMAYLKCHYPQYFIANLLNMAIGSTTKTKEYMTLAKKYNISFLPPSINKSKDVYVIEGNTLRIPLTLIKNIGSEAVKWIMNAQAQASFADFYDFVTRIYGQSVNKKTIEALITADAFQDFGENHPTLRHNLDRVLDYASLVNNLEKEYVLKPEWERVEDLTEEEKRKEEYATYGFYISNHPASKYQKNVMKLENIKSFFDKYVYSVVLVENIKKIKTKKGEDMAFITASDETDSANFVLFHHEITQVPSFSVGDLIYLRGRVTKRFSDYQININRLQVLKPNNKKGD